MSPISSLADPSIGGLLSRLPIEANKKSIREKAAVEPGMIIGAATALFATSPKNDHLYIRAILLLSHNCIPPIRAIRPAA